MITSYKQYTVAKEKLKKIKESIVATQKTKVPQVLVRASLGQMKELLADLKRDMSEYETLHMSHKQDISISSLEDLMKAPIRYRLAKKMTIEQFAKEVEVHSRQIARYETEQYHNATTDTLIKILERLKIDLKGSIHV